MKKALKIGRQFEIKKSQFKVKVKSHLMVDRIGANLRWEKHGREKKSSPFSVPFTGGTWFAMVVKLRSFASRCFTIYLYFSGL